MAGIWERVKATADDRLPVHLLEASTTLYAFGAYTRTNIVQALNAKLETPLAGQELTDLTALADMLDAQGTQLLKLVYMQKICAWTIAAEAGSVTEAAFRAGLGL